jgi:hypothetical protein
MPEPESTGQQPKEKLENQAKTNTPATENQAQEVQREVERRGFQFHARLDTDSQAKLERARQLLNAKSNDELVSKFLDLLEQENGKYRYSKGPPKHLTVTLEIPRALCYALFKLQTQLWSGGYKSSFSHALVYALLNHCVTTVDPAKTEALNLFLETGKVDNRTIDRYLHIKNILPCRRDLESFKRNGQRPTRMVLWVEPVQRWQVSHPRLRAREPPVPVEETEQEELEPVASEEPKDAERIETTFGEAYT